MADHLSILLKKHKFSPAKQCKLISVHKHPLSSSIYDDDDDSGGQDDNNVDAEHSSNIKNDKNKKSLFKANSIDAKTLVTTTWNGIDPLSAAFSTSFNDDNNKNGIISDNNSNEKFLKERKMYSYIDDDFKNWSLFRTKILNKFNTVEKLTIRSSFQFEKGTPISISSSATANVSQKTRTRLEQLDEMDEGTINEMRDLSQQEYIKRIEEMNMAIINAWNNDQRVKALKIAIQCTKQLSAINVVHFYPNKFVLITDILDNFGELVYDRIDKKMQNQIDDAKETCLNWFYKISSIRELLPRFYIECSVLKIYRFLIAQENQRDEYERIFLRLTRMIRGIGDPLVAIYCRVYLCRVVIKLFPEMKKIFLQNIYDIIDNVDKLTCPFVSDNLASQNIDFTLYYSLFNPAIDWIFNCLFYKGSNYENILKYFRNKIEFFKNRTCSAFILNSMITCFPSNFIAQNISKLIELIKSIYSNNNIDDTSQQQQKMNKLNLNYPKYLLIKSIGESLINEDNFFEKYSIEKNLIFIDLWSLLLSPSNYDQIDRNEFLFCLETWSEIIAKYSSIDYINKLLGDIIQIINNNHNKNNNEPYENLQQLYHILQKIIINGSANFSWKKFFSMNNLLPFLDLFHKESIKIDACKLIVSSFNQNCSIINDNDGDPQPDPVILNSITYLCKLLHDSIDLLTLDDEKRQISALIIGFIRRISYKQQQDLEARLNFYIESRANFSNLDNVLAFIVQQVNTLSMDAYRFVNGKHTKKTISFVNACMAFSFITIPSIYDIFTRLQLYLSSAHCSLINGCLPQTDAFIKLAITSIRQLPPYSENFDGKLYSNDEFVYQFASQLLSTLIVVPDNPELGILYLFKGLYNVLKEYRFETNSNYKLLIWMNMAKYLATCIQPIYPYHIDRIDSNDSLYVQDQEFIHEIETYFDIIYQESLDMFKKFQHDFDIKQQCNLALEFINLIIYFGNVQKMSHVIDQLWNWICKTVAKNKLHCFDNKMKSIYNYLGKTLNIQLKTTSNRSEN